MSYGVSSITCAYYQWTKECRAGRSNVAWKRAKWLGLLCALLPLGLFLTRRDLINWKESDGEGDRKAICSLGQKGSVLGREGGELLHGSEQRRQF